MVAVGNVPIRTAAAFQRVTDDQARSPYGVLHHDTLERVAGAQHWHSGFHDALSAAVRASEIKRLGCGYYRRDLR
jgi:hypothetical protein